MQTALKLINAALPKHKDSQLLRVLKGLALTRLDRADEAFKAGTQPPTSLQLLPCPMAVLMTAPAQGDATKHLLEIFMTFQHVCATKQS